MKSSTTKFSFLLITIVSLSLFLSHCKEDDPGPQPIIVSFTPNTGPEGTAVTITGENFSATANANAVKFNGTVAVVSSASATEIVTAVPAGAITGKITVTVNGVTGASEADFIAGPAIASFTPTTGVAGTAVTIMGINYSTNLADNVVKFNNISATVTAATSTQLTVEVPSGATTGKISVSANGFTSTSTSDFTIPLPTITSFSPAHALPGQAITITGTNFAPGSLTLNKVKVNNVDASVVSATGEQLVATVPAITSTGKITVDVGGQMVNSINDIVVQIDIPRDGLVAFYPFSGNANDVSGNNLHGTLSKLSVPNSVLPVPAIDRFGNADRSYSFDGASSYITMGDPLPLQISNQITVSAWVKVSGIDPSKVKAIISKVYFDPTAGNNAKGGYYLYHLGVAAIFHLNYGLTNDNVSYGSAISPSTWILITMVADGTSYKLYRNGQLVKEEAGNGLTETRGDLIIGKYGVDQLFSGIIDDIAIYNRPLSATEVTQLYNQTLTKY